MVKLQSNLGDEIVENGRNHKNKDEKDYENGNRPRNPPFFEAIDEGVEQVSNEKTDKQKGNRRADPVGYIKKKGRQESDDPPPDDGGEPSGCGA